MGWFGGSLICGNGPYKYLLNWCMPLGQAMQYEWYKHFSCRSVLPSLDTLFFLPFLPLRPVELQVFLWVSNHAAMTSCCLNFFIFKWMHRRWNLHRIVLPSPPRVEKLDALEIGTLVRYPSYPCLFPNCAKRPRSFQGVSLPWPRGWLPRNALGGSPLGAPWRSWEINHF